MWTIGFRLREDELNQRDKLAPVIEAVDGAAYLTPERYDLNKRDKWKPYDPEKVIVDGLAQRSSLIRLEGEGTVYIALGKRATYPAVMLEWPERPPIPEVFADWDDCFGVLSLDMGWVDSDPWSDQVDSASLESSSGTDLKQGYGWQPGEVPAGVEKLEKRIRAESGMMWEAHSNSVWIVLSETGALRHSDVVDELLATL